FYTADLKTRYFRHSPAKAWVIFDKLSAFTLTPLPGRQSFRPVSAPPRAGSSRLCASRGRHRRVSHTPAALGGIRRSSCNSPRLRPWLALGASALALWAVAPPVAAQEAAASDDTFQIEELVVTAEKREQALQDVPVAVSAYTSQQRDVAGIT